jgi:polysaccharide pyruvyl transferase WcaK-like protein
MQNKRKFYIRVVTSFHNEGDLLINRALIDAFSPYGDIVIDQNASPKFFLDSLTAEIPNCMPTQDFYKSLMRDTLSQNDVYLLTIPGHFFGRGLGKAFSIFAGAGFFYLLKVFGVKIFKLGGCVGPFDWSVKFAEKFRSGAFNFYGLRDSISRQNIGNAKNIQSFPDMAFYSKDITSIETSSENRSGILISFREETNAMSVTAGYKQQITDKLFTLLNPYKDTETIKFCYQVPSDKEFNQALCQTFSEAGFKCEFINKKLPLKLALKTYSNALMVLSNRLHILLPCIGLGTSHIGIIDKENHHKILGIYRDIGLEDLLVDINQEVESSLPDNLAQQLGYDKLREVYHASFEHAEQAIKALINDK